jgi:hypothetical protein
MLEEPDENIVYQVFGALTLSVGNVQRALDQPGIPLQEDLLLRAVVTTAGIPIRVRQLEVEERHQPERCPGRTPSDTRNVNIP